MLRRPIFYWMPLKPSWINVETRLGFEGQRASALIGKLEQTGIFSGTMAVDASLCHDGLFGITPQRLLLFTKQNA